MSLSVVLLIPDDDDPVLLVAVDGGSVLLPNGYSNIHTYVTGRCVHRDSYSGTSYHSEKTGQPPYNGHTVHHPYISTSEEGTTSLQWTHCSPSIHFYFRRRDNLYTMDKMLVPQCVDY